MGNEKLINPNSQGTHGLRACLVCGLVKPGEYFLHNGCNNCEEFLRSKGSQKNVAHHTSSHYGSVIALCMPENKWTRGLYAVTVQGRLPAATINEMNERGLQYRPKDIKPYIC